MLTNKIRIIGGKWRGKKLTFPDKVELRPTLDRVRETLFNWLSSVIDGANCLDLFSGSGALGIEALSRGAKEVVFVDRDIEVIRQLKHNIELLKVKNASVIHVLANEYIQDTHRSFDIIFLDPPFHQNLLTKTITLLEKSKLTKSGSYIYIEMAAEENLHVPENWVIQKEKKAGNVKYYLVVVGSM